MAHAQDGLAWEYAPGELDESVMSVSGFVHSQLGRDDISADEVAAFSESIADEIRYVAERCFVRDVRATHPEVASVRIGYEPIVEVNTVLSVDLKDGHIVTHDAEYPLLAVSQILQRYGDAMDARRAFFFDMR